MWVVESFDCSGGLHEHGADRNRSGKKKKEKLTVMLMLYCFFYCAATSAAHELVGSLGFYFDFFIYFYGNQRRLDMARKGQRNTERPLT